MTGAPPSLLPLPTAHPPELAISWPLSSYTGYGVTGTYIALAQILAGGRAHLLSKADTLAAPILFSEQVGRLAMASHLWQQQVDALKAQGQKLVMDCPVLHGAGNFLNYFSVSRFLESRRANIGYAAIEHTNLPQHGRERAKAMHAFVAISSFNEDLMKSWDIGPVHLARQGVDTAIFSPRPRADYYRDRFVIFSGGKFEHRKGQDIVVAAFKAFHARHPEAMLLCSWGSVTGSALQPFLASGHIATIPDFDPKRGGMQIEPWLESVGVARGDFLTVPFAVNGFMPGALAVADCALFPSRCEGGTNLVAMECIAMGIPTIVADNTGQADLCAHFDVWPLKDQRPVRVEGLDGSTEGWGESSLEEVLAQLEAVYQDHKAAKARALKAAEAMAAWDWMKQNRTLLSLLSDLA